jgi:LysM repeat protein
MKGLGQLFVGLMTAVGTSLLVLSAASLAIIEGGFHTAFVASPTQTAITQAVDTPAPAETAVEGTGATTIPTLVLPSPSPTAESISCPIPPGWSEYTVLPGDTLELLAGEVGITAEEIYQKNCLDSKFLIAGMVLRLPNPAPTSTVPPALPTAAPPLPTAAQCGPFPGWTVYIVRPGDNLFRLSLSYGVNLATLKFANCLSGDFIYAGQRLFVPNVPTLTPRVTSTPTATVTATTQPPTTQPSLTPTPIWTGTITATPTSTSTSTFTPTPTYTPTPTLTNTATSTSTPTSTAEPTATHTSTSTSTPESP